MSRRFDVAVGNPPYQGEACGGRKNYSPPIYPNFIDSAYSVADKVVILSPARFLFNAGATLKKWNEKMLNDEHLKVVYYEGSSSKVFVNTDIRGGVAITYRDKSTKHNPIGLFIPHEMLKSILNKVSDDLKGSNLRDIIYTPSNYKLSRLFHSDNPQESSEVSGRSKVGSSIFQRFPHLFKKDVSPDSEDDYISIYGRQNNKRTHRWVRRDYINVIESFNKYKVFLPRNNGSGVIGEVLSTPLIGEPLIGEPLIGHTETFMSIGSFNHQSEANACMKYIKSKFTRTLLGILKATQNNSRRTWAYVPLQDFTEDSDIDWSQSISDIDKQLYKKYNLNEDEIEFIETNIKEMS